MTTPQTALPLTMGQLDFWEEFLAHEGKSVSTVAHVTVLEGPLDEPALCRAIETMIAETDVLALRFGDGAVPMQYVDPDSRPQLRLLDLRAETAPEAAARAMMQSDIDTPLDLRAGKLSASWLMRIGETRWMWYLRGHHIFLDGYSMALIERRVARLYGQFRGDGVAGQAFGRFAAYLDEEQGYQRGVHWHKARAFWQEQLAAGPVPPTLRKGSEDYPQTPRSAEIDLGHLSAPLRQATEGIGLGWPDLLIISTALWLWHRPESDGMARGGERLIWLPLMGRMGSVAANIPAMALNILPLRVCPDGNASLGAAIATIARDLKTLRRHGRYRIEQLGRDFGLAQDQRFFFSPLVNVMPFEPAQYVGCEAQREVLAAGPGDGFNVTISADARGEGLQMYLDADPTLTSADLFDAHVQGLPRAFADIFAALTEVAAESPLGALLEEPISA